MVYFFNIRGCSVYYTTQKGLNGYFASKKKCFRQLQSAKSLEDIEISTMKLSQQTGKYPLKQNKILL